MQFPLNPKPFRRPSVSHRPILRALPFLLLNGALVQVASAQASGAQTAQPSALSSLVSTLSIFAFFALLVGAVRPKTFAFLFKEKATRGRVCAMFGAAWFFLVILAGPLRPRPVPATNVAQSAPGESESASGKDQSAQVRLAENRAKAAEARAARAEKAAASADAKAKRDRANEERVKKDLGIPDSSSDAPAPEAQSKAAPAKEPLAENVEVMDIPGVGKRQAGTVDEVVYVIGKAETAKTLGSDMYRREADGVFYVLTVVADNGAKTTHDVTTRLMKLIDDQGREFNPSSEGATALRIAGEKSAEAFSAQLQPGVTRKLTLVYDAPEGAQGLKLHIPAGGFGFGKSANIQVPTASE